MENQKELTCQSCSAGCPVDFMALALSEGIIGYPAFPCLGKETTSKLEPNYCSLIFEKMRT
ncbi:MAG: hypothetical protein PHN75_11650 [Syntrophales bacterium]|nr:hypothetical protein [Syntrophales bacterium]